MWLGLTAISVCLAALEASVNWSGMTVTLQGRPLGFTLYPPVTIAASLTFWLGPTYGATTAYVSTLVSGLVGGLAPTRAALFALGTPAEVLLLWFLALMLRVRPALREYRDWWRFGAAALIAATASSLDIMLYNEAHRLPIPAGQRLWEGWIFGDLVQLCLVVAPLLWLAWEPAHRRALARLGTPQRDLSAVNTVLLLAFVWSTLAGLALLGLRLLVRAMEIGDGSIPIESVMLAPRIREMETFLIVLVGALLLSTMALTAALAGRGERSTALSLSDDLTGAFNRRAFRGLFDREEERSRVLGRPLSLIYFNIDHFKTINDRFGHATGDRVLADVVSKARAVLPAHDLLFRWGGDEFIILLPHTTGPEAEVIAEALRAHVAARVSAGEGRPGVTLSIGLSITQPGDSRDTDLIRSADAAVYRAKALGRNRVVTASHLATADGLTRAPVSATAAPASTEDVWEQTATPARPQEPPPSVDTASRLPRSPHPSRRVQPS
jgi:diguanylate cyclase (GGDEF)-like protein